ncbi:DMT family transporter [Microvirga sp. 2MCAF38]|uniref:DMT family transporter n=1 Tax=Microvirga sp. 2MCAF38 TaxID=3232989 RepID=UPI003F9454E1
MQFGPIARMAASIALLSFMDAIIKGMHASYPTLQIVFLRFACGSIVASCVFAAMRPGWPSRDTVIANAMRSVVAVLTAIAFFYALGELPLAETLVLSFLAPMFIAFLGLVLLKERIDGRIVGALVVGFGGTLIVVFGQTGEAGAVRSWSGVAAALLSAITYAFSIVLLRQRAQRDKFIHIVFFQAVGPMILSAPFAFYVWQPLDWTDLGWFLTMGSLGVAGHMLMASAYAKAPAARLAPLEYTALIWAALIGYGVFSEVPTWATLGGGALIVVAAAITSRR